MIRLPLQILWVAVLTIVACSSDEQQPNPAIPDTSVLSGLPNLTPGSHIGYIVGFDVLNTQQAALAENRFAESVAAGMSVSRIQLDWQELEPEPGIYDETRLTEALQTATRSDQQPFFTLSTLDTGGLTLPDDLMSENQLSPAEGLSLDGVEITTRFEEFLEWLTPQLANYNVWGLSLANEASTLFGDIDQQVITSFLVNGAEHANSLTDQIGITVTVAGAHDSDESKVAFIDDLLPHLDMLAANYYCLDSSTLDVSSAADWQLDFDTLVRRAGNKPVFFQELGCPAGIEDRGDTVDNTQSILGTSVEIQTDFFDFAFEQIESQDKIRAAIVFQLNDWSPESAQLIADPLQTEADGNTADKLVEWLTTVGLCRWSDGQCRQAYQLFLASATRLAAQR